MTFSEWMKRRRKEMRMTQAHLADQAGFTRSYIVTLEGGGVTLPQARTRNRIHRVLGTDDEELQDLGILANDEYGGEYSPNAEKIKQERFPVKIGRFVVSTEPKELPDVDEKRANLANRLESFLLTKERYDALVTIMFAFAAEDHAPDPADWTVDHPDVPF